MSVKSCSIWREQFGKSVFSQHLGKWEYCSLSHDVPNVQSVKIVFLFWFYIIFRYRWNVISFPSIIQLHERHHRCGFTLKLIDRISVDMWVICDTRITDVWYHIGRASDVHEVCNCNWNVRKRRNHHPLIRHASGMKTIQF